MSIWSDITSGVGTIWDNLNDGTGFEVDDIIGLLGAYGGYQGWFNTDQEKAGYQGKIPDYTAVRDRVPIDWDSDRRAGEYGQRYFTDTTYAETPEDMLKRVNAPSLADAKAGAIAQAAQLQQQNTQPFAQGGIVDAMTALRGTPTAQQQIAQKQRPPMPMQAQGMPQRPPMPQQGIPQPPQIHPQGIAAAPQVNYKRGPTDGMADRMPARIDGQAPAEFSHGEFMLPADIVSHVGNGNSDAGAEQLYAMMDRIRQARTGSNQQGKQINPNSFLPA
jgi:hypothetical protein